MILGRARLSARPVVQATGGSFGAVSDERLVDVDGDGLADRLELDLEVQIDAGSEGEYAVVAALRDSMDERFVYATVPAADYPAGSTTVTLDFWGPEIEEHGVDGPFTLTDVILIKPDQDDVPVVEQTDLYTTGPWAASLFEPRDTDNDGIPDRSDVCPAVADPLQEDGDLDGVGDACDNCINAPNPTQADADEDRFGDVCDLCPLTVDSVQSDFDGDLLGDSCDPDIDNDTVLNGDDCNDVNASLWYTPPDVTNLNFVVDQVTMHWDSQVSTDGLEVRYDVIKGLLSELRSSGTYDGAICLLDRSAETQVIDSGIPPAGDGYYFLARARTDCGVPPYGPGDRRDPSMCP